MDKHIDDNKNQDDNIQDNYLSINGIPKVKREKPIEWWSFLSIEKYFTRCFLS